MFWRVKMLSENFLLLPEKVNKYKNHGFFPWFLPFLNETVIELLYFEDKLLIDRSPVIGKSFGDRLEASGIARGCEF